MSRVSPNVMRRILGKCLTVWLFLMVACADVPATPTQDATTTDAGADAVVPREALVGGANEAGEGFVDWSSGSYAPKIISGPQGGQHIWVSALTHNLWPKKARVAVTMYIEATGVADELVKPGRVELTGTLKSSDVSGWLIYAGLPAFVKEPCKIRGKRIRVELEVSDLYAVKATDKAWIVPYWEGYCDP